MMAVGSILMSSNYDPTLCMRVQSKKPFQATQRVEKRGGAIIKGPAYCT